MNRTIDSLVRNGKAKERSVTLGCGTVKVNAPRINDQRAGITYTSNILPPYLRKSPNIESLLPILYLKGLSTNKFTDALVPILGEGVKGLSAGSIVALKKQWEKEFESWSARNINKKFAYIWADGVNVKVRLGDDKKVCLLVIIGVDIDGNKELIAVEAGWRESKDSWKLLLDNLVRGGFKAPLIAIADGALGFWSALRECDGYQQVQEQRCWIHKMGNVLNCFPKRLQPQVKSMLHEIMYADKKSHANSAKKIFENAFKEKYPKGVEKLNKDWEELTAFFNFPAAHWKHLRSSNPIESTFASVKLRTKATRGAGSVITAKTMTFKLMREAEKKWRVISSPNLIKEILNGVEYKDGIVLQGGNGCQEVMPA